MDALSFASKLKLAAERRRAERAEAEPVGQANALPVNGTSRKNRRRSSLLEGLTSTVSTRLQPTLSTRAEAPSILLPTVYCCFLDNVSMWSMIKSCTGAWQGGRVLDSGGQRIHPAQRERSRARSPTLPRMGCGASPRRRVQGLATAHQVLRFQSRLGECTARIACAVHSHVGRALPCDAEAWLEPSRAVSSIFRNSLPL